MTIEEDRRGRVSGRLDTTVKRDLRAISERRSASGDPDEDEKAPLWVTIVVWMVVVLFLTLVGFLYVKAYWG